ncbi:hypothetical protein B0H66DRAFT_480109 [Apodospora peruviana]|uniref:Uncharacterized protein n=1 Tax=Apodospora peruviana TaxID=516989 RepID=A0AAE0I0E4_9PEZI|nr:hypothetical protein B0H66DRAFT_480109 [Apodospora peruviana]
MADGSGDGAGPPPGILSWFPWGQQDLPGWRFDVITLLAVIGEGSVAEHAATITSSTLCLLPRIIPAPQALLRPTRPQRLPEVTAKMSGVYGGTVLDTVGFFANIIHPLEDLKPFAFKVLEIKHTHLVEAYDCHGQSKPKGRGRLWFPWLGRTRPKKVAESRPGMAPNNDKSTSSGSNHKEDNTLSSPTTTTANHLHHAELGQAPRALQKSATLSEKFTDVLTNPTMVNSEERYTVPPALYSPIHIISFVSFLLTIALIAMAAIWKDGTAIVAILLISLASSVVGYASWWRPLLMNRRTTNKVPKGDVVIRTREGAFVLIRCTEEVARELYSGTEECQYVSTKYHRAFMGLGMVLLMVAVVLLGNCGWNSQVFIGGAYIFLNGVYWVMGLLPHEYFWDLSRYRCVDITPEDAKRADKPTSEDPREGTPSFTRTLWYAIRETGRGAWVDRSGALPGTDQWKKWRDEAVRAAWRGERDWKAVKRKNDIMKEDLDQTLLEPGVDGMMERVDEAEQRAPLLEVQPIRRQGTFSG